MRPKWVIYSTSPDMSPGLSALRRQITARGSQAPSDVLGPISALREIEAVCNAVVSGRGAPFPANRASLIADSQVALDQLGAEVRQEIAPLLPDCKKQIGQLGSTLDSVPAIRTASLTVDSLLRRLGTAEAVAAAWRDVVATFRDVSASPHDCEMRLLQLVELAENRGVDYDAWAARAERILGDDARVLGSLGESVAADAEAGRLGGVSEDRRVRLCEDTLEELSETSGVAVWLALRDAALLHSRMTIGPITLYAGHGWPDQITGSNTDTEARESSAAAPELGEADFVAAPTDALGDWPSRAGSTLVRVWFQQSTPAFARDQARLVVRGLIDLAETDTLWQLLDGEMTWTPKTWSGTGFADPEDNAKARKRKPPRLDRTQTELQQFDGAFIERWLRGDEDAERSAADALWVATTKQTQSHEQRIILAVRSVEHALGNVKVGAKGTWTESAARYLKSVLVNHVLVNELQDALLCGLNCVERAHERPAGLMERISKMASPPADERYTWSMLAADLAEVLPQVRDIVAAGSMEARIVGRTADMLLSPEKALNWLAQVGLWFDRMLDRTNRKRNALVHGTGKTHKLLENVDEFAVLLATYASDDPLRRVQDERELLMDLELDRTQSLDRERRLQAGALPAEALFNN